MPCGLRAYRGYFGFQRQVQQKQQEKTDQLVAELRQRGPSGSEFLGLGTQVIRLDGAEGRLRIFQRLRVWFRGFGGDLEMCKAVRKQEVC